ncbi:unnamed protein product [Effrenium voratum]|uniref:Uncharacterized protein n=1 Tax=Effrenium voratum TaxID=2562239 RepID=A0AA36J635_9DINO|nr:unnamed protein product [Effrenium voratum]
MGFNAMNAMINSTGNYGFIGFLNTMENLSLLDGRFYEWLGIPAAATDLRVPLVPLPLRMLAAVAAGLYVILSLLPLARASKGAVDLAALLPRSLCRSLENLEKWQHPWKLVNYQGKFSGMHDFRWEPILSASLDGVHWQQIRWRYKLNQGPRYHDL